MSDIDTSNVVVTSETTDADTGDLVITVDGVEVQRIPRPEIANELAIRRWILQTAFPRIDQIRAQMTTVSNATFTDPAVNQALHAIAQAVNDLALGLKRDLRLTLEELDEDS